MAPEAVVSTKVSPGLVGFDACSMGRGGRRFCRSPLLSRAPHLDRKGQVDDRNYPLFVCLVLALALAISYLAEWLIEWTAGGITGLLPLALPSASEPASAGRRAAGGKPASGRKVARSLRRSGIPLSRPVGIAVSPGTSGRALGVD